MLARLTSIMHKEFIHIIRDPRTLAVIFVMPLMQLILLGYAATTDVRNIPLAVLEPGSQRAKPRLTGIVCCVGPVPGSTTSEQSG